MSWRSIRLNRKVCRSLSDSFLLDFLSAAAAADPDNIEILVQLGDLYSRLGLSEKSVEIDLKLVCLCPQEKVFHYNLACSYSRLNDLDSALLALEKALLLGYDDFEQIQADADLENLRRDPRFRRLMRLHFNREVSR